MDQRGYGVSKSNGEPGNRPRVGQHSSGNGCHCTRGKAGYHHRDATQDGPKVKWLGRTTLEVTHRSMTRIQGSGQGRLASRHGKGRAATLFV